jgi:hypothetical protein
MSSSLINYIVAYSGPLVKYILTGSLASSASSKLELANVPLSDAVRKGVA